MPKDRDEFDIGDFGGRMAKQALTGKGYLDIPTGLSLWKPKKSGSHQIELVPFQCTKNHLRFVDDLRNQQVGGWWSERTFYYHRNVGVNSALHTCLAMTFGKPCPVCEHRAELRKSPHKEETEQAWELRPKDRQLWLVFDHDDPDRGLQLWDEAPWNFFRHLTKYIEGAPKQDRDSYKKFYHPTRGYTIRLTATEVAIGGKKGGDGDKKGGGNNTEYSVHAFYQRERPLPESLWRHGYDLDAMVRQLDYQALKDLYHGVADVDEKEEREKDGTAFYAASGAPGASENGDDHDERPAAATFKNRVNLPPADDTPDEETAAPLTIASRDRVAFDWNAKRVKGVVQRVDAVRQMAWIVPDGSTDTIRMPLEDVELLASDTTFDAKPAPEPEAAPAKQSKRSGPNPWDDDDGTDTRTVAPKAAPKPEATTPPLPKKPRK
jgi:hypothetical protein